MHSAYFDNKFTITFTDFIKSVENEWAIASDDAIAHVCVWNLDTQRVFIAGEGYNIVECGVPHTFRHLCLQQL